jgi:hypothetical protein
MALQDAPKYPRLVEKILGVFETLFGEKYQDDKSKADMMSAVDAASQQAANPRKADATQKAPSEGAREISAAGSIRTISAIQEQPGEEGGSSAGGSQLPSGAPTPAP